MLKFLSENPHEVISAVCVINNKTSKKYTELSCMNVSFGKMTEETIQKYVDENPVTEWAGGYGPNSKHFFNEEDRGDNLNFGIDPVKLEKILKENEIYL